MASPNRYTGLGAGTAVVKSGNANIHAFSVYNANAAVRYFQIHNVAAALSGAEAPVFSFACPTAVQTSLGHEFFGPSGLSFGTIGLTFAISTTRETYTAATASEHSVFILYT